MHGKQLEVALHCRYDFLENLATTVCKIIAVVLGGKNILFGDYIFILTDTRFQDYNASNALDETIISKTK